MVEVIGKGGVNLGQRQVRVGHEDFFRRSAQPYHFAHNQRNRDAGPFDSRQPGTGLGGGHDMRIVHGLTPLNDSAQSAIPPASTLGHTRYAASAPPGTPAGPRRTPSASPTPSAADPWRARCPCSAKRRRSPAPSRR